MASRMLWAFHSCAPAFRINRTASRLAATMSQYTPAAGVHKLHSAV